MPKWIDAKCEGNGISIAYRRTGQGGIPVLFLHGLMANGQCWISVAESLGEGYDLILPDARGHGHSSVPEQGYGYEDHVCDGLALIQNLALESVVLVGHSMGALVGTLLASKFPQMLKALVLVDPTFLSPSVQAEVYASDILAQHRRFLEMPLSEIINEARHRHPHRRPQMIEWIAQARLQTSPRALEVLRPPNPDFRQLIPMIQVPSLLVLGGSQGIVSLELALELQICNPQIQIAQIPLCGHGMHYDRPQELSKILHSFLHKITHE